MTITFYKYSNDTRRVDKTNYLTLVKTINNAVFKNDVDRGEMVLELAYDSTIDANYCYISETGYYYYVGEPIMGKQRVFYPIKTDLKMSKKNEILNLGCIIARQENKYNAYLNDDRFPVLNKQQVNTLAFPAGFPAGEDILLIVNGG